MLCCLVEEHNNFLLQPAPGFSSVASNKLLLQEVLPHGAKMVHEKKD